MFYSCCCYSQNEQASKKKKKKKKKRRKKRSYEPLRQGRRVLMLLGNGNHITDSRHAPTTKPNQKLLCSDPSRTRLCDLLHKEMVLTSPQQSGEPHLEEGLSSQELPGEEADADTEAEAEAEMEAVNIWELMEGIQDDDSSDPEFLSVSGKPLRPYRKSTDWERISRQDPVYARASKSLTSSSPRVSSEDEGSRALSFRFLLEDGEGLSSPELFSTASLKDWLPHHRVRRSLAFSPVPLPRPRPAVVAVQTRSGSGGGGERRSWSWSSSSAGSEQEDGMVFDPELVASLEMAMEQMSKEEWKALRCFQTERTSLDDEPISPRY